MPELARALLAIIEKEYSGNRKFIAAFDTFTELCRTSLDPKIGTDVIKEMLIQHLLTERLFSTIFDNPDFFRHNAIAAEIEKVIDALTSRSFNRHEFLKSLDRFYVAIEGAARSVDGWLERQHFLDTVYERFFQGYSVKRADTYGIVYTPQEIVDFMCASVDEVLRREFSTSIEEPGVQIIDPCVGTGSYIVNLLHRTPRHKLKYKYEHDLFCNEIMLLPYYIASLNIEHEYYEQMREYRPFQGICFGDTLELAKERQISLFMEENTERVEREKAAQIMVVIGNPPYNVGQKNENDNNKNRKYPTVDGRIKETYVKASQATNRNKYYDAYVRFFRWATDRLQERDGIVCLVSNNSFVHKGVFDGIRKYLLQDFTQVYHLDLHGDVVDNPKLSGSTHNVFGIKEGIGITIAVRASRNSIQKLYYYRVPEYWRKKEKLAFLAEKKGAARIEWVELQPDEKYTWRTEGLHPEFATFLSLGNKDAKMIRDVELVGGLEVKAIFKQYSLGAVTNRDNWVYDFNKASLVQKVTRFIEAYNSEVDRWKRAGEPKDIDSFVYYDDTKIKWSRDLKSDLKRKRYAQFHLSKIQPSLYRPYTRKFYFFDPILSQDIFSLPKFFPISAEETENEVIIVGGYGRKHFAALASNYVSDLNFYADPAQCFPYYTYSGDGSNRRENITDWALSQFQTKFGSEVTKWDIFHYVYAMLHHSQYLEYYAENLKHGLPYIPLLHKKEEFLACVRIGKQLMDIHLHYEQAKEYPLKWIENQDVPFSWRIGKMKITSDRTAVKINESLTLAEIPQECFQYQLGNRSALDWVIDQYQFGEDKRSGMVSDPNNLDDEEYIVRLVGKVITVSVETVRLVNELAQAVKMEDWMSQIVEENL